MNNQEMFIMSALCDELEHNVLSEPTDGDELKTIAIARDLIQTAKKVENVRRKEILHWIQKEGQYLQRIQDLEDRISLNKNTF